MGTRAGTTGVAIVLACALAAHAGAAHAQDGARYERAVRRACRDTNSRAVDGAALVLDGELFASGVMLLGASSVIQPADSPQSRFAFAAGVTLTGLAGHAIWPWVFSAVGSQEHPSRCSALLGTREGEARIELVEAAAASMRGGERAVRDLQLVWSLGALAVGGAVVAIAVPMLALGDSGVRQVGGSFLGIGVATPVFFAARVALLPRNLRAPMAFARAWPVPLVAGGPGVGVAGTF